MKLVIIVPDGLCDLRYPTLNNLSPVEYARTPGLDKMMRGGRVGLARTMYPGLPLGSLVGLLGILGYDPRAYFPLGRAIFEAHALGLNLNPQDLAFRCNIVQIDQDDRLIDFTAEQITETLAHTYLAGCQIDAPFELYHDLSYRNVLIYRNCTLPVTDFHLFEPHENVGRLLRDILPRYKNEPFTPLVELMLASRRNELMLWPWGASRTRTFPKLPFKGYLVTALSFLSGMMTVLGGEAVMPSGTTGYLDSNLRAKVAALIQRFSDFDVGLIHCNAPDEEAHLGHLQGKVQAIEDIDRLVVNPLLEYLENLNQPCRILFCPDHYTCCQDGRHHSQPVPYVVAGPDVSPNHTLSSFSEVAITKQAGKALESYRLISTVLNAQNS